VHMVAISSCTRSLAVTTRISNPPEAMPLTSSLSPWLVSTRASVEKSLMVKRPPADELRTSAGVRPHKEAGQARKTRGQSSRCVQTSKLRSKARFLFRLTFTCFETQVGVYRPRERSPESKEHRTRRALLTNAACVLNNCHNCIWLLLYGLFCSAILKSHLKAQ